MNLASEDHRLARDLMAVKLAGATSGILPLDLPPLDQIRFYVRSGLLKETGGGWYLTKAGADFLAGWKLDVVPREPQP